MSVRQVRALASHVALAVAATVIVVSPGPDLAAAASTPSVSAYDFVDSVGVNVHMHFSDTAYADSDRVLALLTDLGVRHVRDGLAGGRPDEVAALSKLGAAGISLLLHLSGRMRLSGPVVDPAQLTSLQQLAPYVAGVEPTNELDCRMRSWVNPLRTYAVALDKAVAGSPATAALPMLAPSFCRPESVAAYGAAAPADVANVHTYAAGKPPELAAESRLPRFAAIQGSGMTMAVTESGYTNVSTSSFPYGTSEANAADHLVRTLLEHRRLGIARTYLYELLDEKPDVAGTDPEQHYGLVRNDGTPKPAYTAVRNLLADLAGGAPGRLGTSSRADAPYATTIEGGGSLLRTLTVSDPGGTGQTVALWLAGPAQGVTSTVRLDVSQSVTATTRRPSRDNAATSLGTGGRFDIPVDGAVTLVHLGGAAARLASATCSAGSDFATLATSYGATVNRDLAPAAWSGAPAPVADVPSWLTGGTTVGAGGQTTAVTVPGAPTAWTVGVWARTSRSSAEHAPFLRTVGDASTSLTTYDLTNDVPSHAQVGAYAASRTSLVTQRIVGQANPDSWHFLALTSSPAGTRLWIDGVPAGSVGTASGVLTAVQLGALGSGGFRGALSSLVAFPAALGNAQLLALATAAPRRC